MNILILKILKINQKAYWNCLNRVWILDYSSSDKTMVTYAWNGELLGNFPDFGLKKAWITQGTEVLTWLNEALSIKVKS